MFGVPGPITSATSRGVHDLLKTGDAKVATAANDVLAGLIAKEDT